MEIIDSRDDWEPNRDAGLGQSIVALRQMVENVGARIDAAGTRLEDQLDGLERRLDELETEKWFARNVGAKSYRPEITKWEQIGGPWSTEWRRQSPYRR